MLPMSDELWNKITFLVGNQNTIRNMSTVPVMEPFSDDILEFLDIVSKILMKDKAARDYPDVVTLGFWLRKSNMTQLKSEFEETRAGVLRTGRGTIFHIAPSNVAVNYAYSLFTGLLTGNSNIVRLPTKNFSQINIINSALKQALEQRIDMKDFICLIRYSRSQVVNDALSAIADVRVIWGGDTTIEELRKSPLAPRATEITFADRISFCLIDSDEYLAQSNYKMVAQGFYNDTYLTDQNACTSPKLVVWMGNQKEKAKKIFWPELEKLVDKRYEFQSVQGVNKLTELYLLAAIKEEVYKEEQTSNLCVRVKVKSLEEDLIAHTSNSGYFLEYDCDNLLDIKSICTTKCQTLSYLGDKNVLLPLLSSGIKGIDRVVPIGKTMDFDLYWDGYNLVERMTRSISI
jgi:hypothetical protein